jgi:hypothetical protein
MNNNGKRFTKEEAAYEIHNLYNRIREIECSDEYTERSEAGDDTLVYQIEAIYDEISYLEQKYGI